MCGKAAVSHLSWKDIYNYASSLTAPASMPANLENRVNISPSRLLRKSEPESMVWETLPAIFADGDTDQPVEAIWPFLPHWSKGQLPQIKGGKLISTANARLRDEEKPFAPTYMGAWSKNLRVVIPVSWFYEFDARVKPQIPYAVFPLNAPCWLLCGLANWFTAVDGSQRISITIITVNPNEALKSVGHHRSPAILQDQNEAAEWLRGSKDAALSLLRPYPNESMGVEAVPMGIKIPGNENLVLPGTLSPEL